MKKFVFMVAVAMMAAIGANAQTSLVGRVYHNPNVMSTMYKDIDKLFVEKKADALKKKEKETGRKLTEAEIKQFDEEMKKVETKFKAIKSGTSMAMTVTFMNDKTATVKAKMRMTDEAMKAADIGWLKRKAMKAAMAIMPATDMSYIVKGNMVILKDEEEYDTLHLNSDGKTLTGKTEGIKYSLTRTK